jgi:hypothetical protein
MRESHGIVCNPDADVSTRRRRLVGAPVDGEWAAHQAAAEEILATLPAWLN